MCLAADRLANFPIVTRRGDTRTQCVNRRLRLREVDVVRSIRCGDLLVVAFPRPATASDDAHAPMWYEPLCAIRCCIYGCQCLFMSVKCLRVIVFDPIGWIYVVLGCTAHASMSYELLYPTQWLTYRMHACQKSFSRCYCQNAMFKTYLCLPKELFNVLLSRALLKAISHSMVNLIYVCQKSFSGLFCQKRGTRLHNLYVCQTSFSGLFCQKRGTRLYNLDMQHSPMMQMRRCDVDQVYCVWLDNVSHVCQACCFACLSGALFMVV